MRKVLVTGGCGFIGSNFIRMALRNEPHWEITNLDLLTYSGNPENLKDVEENENYFFVQGDICNPSVVDPLVDSSHLIFNFAAESHVDRSIQDADWFVRTNVLGTQVLLNAVKKAQSRPKFIQISTDEVYGSIPDGFHAKEDAVLNPTSPYAASKAAADHIALSFHKTHKLDVVVTRSTNNYGPYQHPEKMIPLFITNLLEDKPVPLYDDGSQIRDWIHVEDNCEAIWLVAKIGRCGEIYNIGARQDPEWTNFRLTSFILNELEKSENKIKKVKGIRPGHDQRYAVAVDKLREKGWTPKWPLEEGLRRTIQWYIDHKEWWLPLKSNS